MDHVVYLDTQAKELKNLLSGQKTMILRGATGRKLPHGRVNAGDVLYFINNNAEGVIHARAVVSSAFHSEKMSEDESRALMRQNQSKLRLTPKQEARWAGKRYLVLIEVAEVQLVSPFTIDKSNFGNMDDWLPVEKIELVKKEQHPMNHFIEHLPKLYLELADWWPVLSAPEEYAEEAAIYEKALRAACSFEPVTLLELGSGGGNNASHLKRHFQMTLVDLAPGMLKVSQALNPECEHIHGDMRTVRLGRQFDLVFIQDAIVYMKTEIDLCQAMQTAYIHCRPGGAVLFTPDYIRENFKTATDHGGHDFGNRSLRYLAWTLEPDPDGTYLYIMAYLLREGNGEVRCILDQHQCGLFSRDQWLQWMTEAGFEASSGPFVHSEIPPGDCGIFVGRKPTNARR